MSNFPHNCWWNPISKTLTNLVSILEIVREIAHNFLSETHPCFTLSLTPHWPWPVLPFLWPLTDLDLFYPSLTPHWPWPVLPFLWPLTDLDPFYPFSDLSLTLTCFTLSLTSHWPWPVLPFLWPLTDLDLFYPFSDPSLTLTCFTLSLASHWPWPVLPLPWPLTDLDMLYLFLYLLDVVLVDEFRALITGWHLGRRQVLDESHQFRNPLLTEVQERKENTLYNGTSFCNHLRKVGPQKMISQYN